MDNQSASAGDVKDLERRLSEWQPSAAGLDPDRLLFAAGRDSVRPGWGRIAWPIVSGCLAVVAMVFAVGLAQERAARLDLAAQLGNQKPAAVPAPSLASEAGWQTEPPAASSYLAARQNPDAWLAVKTSASETPASPTQPIWNARSPGNVLDP